jgi:putative tricarboxylic transport membrane protein
LSSAWDQDNQRYNEVLHPVLGCRFEENFRRATLISRGDPLVFIERPISAFSLALCVLLLAGQFYVWLRSMRPKQVPAFSPG